MKNAKYWQSKAGEHYSSDAPPGMGSEEPNISIELVKKIQLDALKEGMRMASGKIKPTCQDKDCGCDWCYIGKTHYKELLTAAEQLTEKDL